MTEDIVLITVDALRHDAIQDMPNTVEWFNERQVGEAITSGAATNWVFPAILSGSYYTSAYNDAGTVNDDLTTLPDVLNNEGYVTGAFLGFNPYLSKWRNRFDEFWNGGLSGTGEEWYKHAIEKWFNRGYRTALLKKRISGSEVLKRAKEWYHDQSSPKFLWVHLMEPHKPYYPGLKAARDIGLFSVYRSIVNLQWVGDAVSNSNLEVQRELYRKCVAVADKLISDFITNIEQGSTVVILGDHGEEFDHGHLGHERLYDECVRVPLLFQNLPQLPESTVRQIDIPAAILQHHSISVPNSWDGQRVNSLEDNPAFMLTPEPSADLLHAGVRNESEKLIYTFDRNTGQKRQTEYYDLVEDPAERHNLSQEIKNENMANNLNEFVSTHQPALRMNAETGLDSPTVEKRLQNLGYK